MESEEEEVLRQINLLSTCRKEIITDLDVIDVCSDLLAQFVISHQDKQLIDHEKTLEDKAEKLLSILETNATKDNKYNSNLIPVFINSLKMKYNWLYKKLTEDVPDAKLIPPHGTLKNKLLENVINEEPIIFTSPKEQKAKVLLEVGGVPCRPVVAVERTSLLEQIKSELKILKSGRYLVIQGMAGCGKSVLVTQVVRSFALVNETFPDGIFWQAIGKECSESKDALLAKMRMLCDKLGESRSPNSFEHGADLLRTAFMKKPNALLILDDVWRHEVIRAFDVGCKTLVTTRDLSIMDVVNGRVKHIRVDDGFTEEESLELFSQTLKSMDLPEEAKAIHSQCKGSPMVISLISSLLQDHQSPNSDGGRWQYYLETLTKRKYSKMRRSRTYEHESIFDAMSLSIEGLPQEKKELYADFALFQDDVGIPCPVLVTLWGKQKFEVEDIMKEFVRKSLAVEEFDPQRKCYVYFIHDLLLDYLKYQLVLEEGREQKSHQKLVEKYVTLCNGEFHKLPDDGYIYFYLGYHLYKAKMHHYFSQVYLDLQFIGEKLRITGPADLLVDVRKYLDFIVGDDTERLKSIEEIQTFSQLVGHRVYGQLDVDVIQIALQTPHLTKIHAQAKELARIANNRLYIEWINARSGQWKHPESTVLCSDHVHCVKFVGTRGGHFIAGLSNGCIQLCDLESSAVCHVFFGHLDSVQSLQIFQAYNNPVQVNGPLQNGDGIKPKMIILSASSDKTCKLWDLTTVLEEVESKPFELIQTGLVFGTSSPSPKLRPDQWAFDHKTDDSYLSFQLHTAELSFAEFSSDGSKVVSTSSNEIMIWSSSDGQIISKISLSFNAFPNLTFQRCRFPPELTPSFLLCSAENQVIVLSADSSSIYAGVEGHAMPIVELLFISSEYFCTVSETEIGIWRIMKTSLKNKACRSRSLSPSRCATIGQTYVDSARIRPSAKTLDPKDIQLGWSNGNSKLSNGIKSPAAKSADYQIRVPACPKTHIEDGNVIVQILREEVLPSKGSGLFLCAATATSAQGRLLACGTSDHKILLWRLDRRQYLGSFTSHNGWVTCLDFSSVDICTLLSGSEDHTVMVWDIEDEEKGTKEAQKNVKFSSSFIPINNSDQGHFLSVFGTEKNSVQIYKDSKRICETFPIESEITSVGISECGRFAAVASSNGKLFQIPAECLAADSQRKNQSHLKFLESLNSNVTCLKFGPSGQYLIASCEDGSFKIFKDFIGLQRLIISKCPIIQIHFVFWNFVVATAQDSSTIVINVDDLENIRKWKLDIPNVHITCSECSSNYTMLGLGSTENGIYLLQLSETSEISGHIHLDSRNSSPVRSLAFNKSATRLAVGHDNGLISIWSMEEDWKKDLELVLHKSWIRTLRFSPEDVRKAQWLISCGDKLVFWNLDKHEVKPRRSSFMAERRRRRSGESPARSNPNRLSLEIPDGSKIGRQGKRELLQQFSFRGNYAESCFTDPTFGRIVTVDDLGIFYLLETLKTEPSLVFNTTPQI